MLYPNKNVQIILKNDFFNIIYTFFGSIFEPCYIQNSVITNHVIKRLECMLILMTKLCTYRWQWITETHFHRDTKLSFSQRHRPFIFTKAQMLHFHRDTNLTFSQTQIYYFHRDIYFTFSQRHRLYIFTETQIFIFTDTDLDSLCPRYSMLGMY